jgi:hypothetical protein
MRRVLAAVLLTSVAGLPPLNPPRRHQNGPPKCRPPLTRVAPACSHPCRVGRFSGRRELKREASGVARSSRRTAWSSEPSRGRPRAITCTLASREIPAELVGSTRSGHRRRSGSGRSPRTFQFHLRRRHQAEGGRSCACAWQPAGAVAVGAWDHQPCPDDVPGVLAVQSHDARRRPSTSVVRWIGHDAAIFGNSGGRSSACRGSRHQRISLGLAGAIPADLARRSARLFATAG